MTCFTLLEVKTRRDSPPNANSAGLKNVTLGILFKFNHIFAHINKVFAYDFIFKLSKLTGVPLDAKDLFVPSVCEHSEERLGGEADHVLFLERH